MGARSHHRRTHQGQSTVHSWHAAWSPSTEWSGEENQSNEACQDPWIHYGAETGEAWVNSGDKNRQLATIQAVG